MHRFHSGFKWTWLWLYTDPWKSQICLQTYEQQKLRGDSNLAGHWYVIACLKLTGALLSRFNKNKTKTSKQTNKKKRHKKEMQKIILHAQKYYFHLRSILLVNNQSNIFILRMKKQFHDHQFWVNLIKRW